MAEPNMDTVNLLVDLAVNDGDPRGWLHLDGRAMTQAEVAVLMSATAVDFAATARIYELRTLEAAGVGALYGELMDLMQGIAAQHPRDAPIVDLIPLLPAAQQIEARTLIDMINVAENGAPR